MGSIFALQVANSGYSTATAVCQNFQPITVAGTESFLSIFPNRATIKL